MHIYIYTKVIHNKEAIISCKVCHVRFSHLPIVHTSFQDLGTATYLIIIQVLYTYQVSSIAHKFIAGVCIGSLVECLELQVHNHIQNNMKLYYVYILVLTSQLIHTGMNSFNKLSVYFIFCVVTSCQSLSEIKETMPIIRKIGEHFNMRCPLYPCNQSGIYNFTKVNMSTGQLELVYQGRELGTTITDLSDAGTYCCKPHCAGNTQSCCVNIQGIQPHNRVINWISKSGLIVVFNFATWKRHNLTCG